MASVTCAVNAAHDPHRPIYSVLLLKKVKVPPVCTGLTTVVVLIEVMNEVHHPKGCEDVS